mgnify:CR=1 FL=1
MFIRECELGSIDGADELLKPLRELARGNGYGLKVMFMTLSGVCGNSRKPIVLMIDEDKTFKQRRAFFQYHFYRLRNAVLGPRGRRISKRIILGKLLIDTFAYGRNKHRISRSILKRSCDNSQQDV